MTKEVMTTEKARAMLAASEVIYSAEEVTAALDRMAGEIKAQLSEKYPLVLCVMTGGRCSAAISCRAWIFRWILTICTPPAMARKPRAARFPGAPRRGRRSRGVACWWLMTFLTKG